MSNLILPPSVREVEPLATLPQPPRKARLGEVVHVMPSLLWPHPLNLEVGPLATFVTALTTDGYPKAICLLPVKLGPCGLNTLAMPYDPEGKQGGSWRFPPEPV